MTKDETMKLALEALKELNEENSYWWQEVDESTLKKLISAEKSLEEALANYIPDDTKMVSGVKDSLTTQQKQGDLESGFFSREAMAAHSDGHVHLKQEQGEPVAWFREEDEEKIYYATKAWDDCLPLYTHPQPKREPLTDEQVDDLHGEANRGFCIEREDYFKAFRDAEAAHGIKE